MKANLYRKPFSRTAFLRTMLLGVPLLPLTTVLAQESTTPSTAPEPHPDAANLRSFVELARSDIRTEKAMIIAQNISFTNDEAADFWPAHREYDTEMNKLLDQRFALIVTFAKHYGTMTDQEAIDLANKVFDLEEKRIDLKRKYFKKFCKIIPPLKAARFFQIENQLNMALDLKIAASLPLIK